MASWADGAVNELIAASGGDHTTIASFEGAHDGETPTNGTNCQGRVKGAITGALTYWSGWQSGQNATTRIVITAETGSEADGVNDASGDDAILNDDRWYVNEGTNAIYLDITKIEVNIDANYFLNVVCDAGGEIRVAKCVIRDGDGYGVTASGNDAAVTIYVGGCLFKDAGENTYKSIILNEDADAVINVFNCTLIGSNGIDGHGALSSRTSGAVVNSKNCALANNTNDVNTKNGGVVNETTNASEDDGDIAITDGVDFTEPSADNYTAVASGGLDGAGTAIADSWFTTLCPTDFAGTAWATPPSIGCFEVAGGALPAAAPKRTSHILFLR